MSQYRANDIVYANQGSNIVNPDPYAVTYTKPQVATTSSKVSNMGNGIVREVVQEIKAQQFIPGGIQQRE